MNARTATRSAARMVGLCVALLAAPASPLMARPAQAAAIPSVLPDAPPDSLLILVPSRAPEAIRQDLASAESMAGTGGADLVFAQGRLGEAKAQVEVRKSEIEALKAKVKLAKEQKNEAEQANLELQVKGQELHLAALEARKEMREAEAELAEARRKAAQARSAFCNQELDLVGKRDDLRRESASGGGAANIDALVRLQIEVRDLERRGLEALKDIAEKDKAVAEKAASVLEKRLKLHAAQQALVAGPKK